MSSATCKHQVSNTQPEPAVEPPPVQKPTTGHTVILTQKEVTGILHAIYFLSDAAWNDYDYEAMRNTADLVDRLEKL